MINFKLYFPIFILCPDVTLCQMCMCVCVCVFPSSNSRTKFPFLLMRYYFLILCFEWKQYIAIFGMILPGSFFISQFWEFTFYPNLGKFTVLNNGCYLGLNSYLLVLFFPPFLHFVPLILPFCLFMCHLLCSLCLNLNLECKWTEFPTWNATCGWRSEYGVREIEGVNPNPLLHRLWLLGESRLQYVDDRISEMEQTLLKVCK